MRASRCFESLSDSGLITLGMVATQCGTRPSQLLEWNDPEDWYARLIFDMRAVVAVNKAQNEQMKRGGNQEWPTKKRLL